MENKIFIKDTVSLVILAVICIIVLFLPISYGYNIYQFAGCDFKEPYRAEAIRGIGVILFPVGCIVGFMDLGQ